MIERNRLTHTILLCVLSLLCLALPAAAQDSETTPDTDNSCRMECREQAAACFAVARENATACFEETGCAALREAFRETCTRENRGSDECQAMREEVASCTQPCRELLREEISLCRDIVSTCRVEQCGLEALPERDERSRRRPRFRR